MDFIYAAAGGALGTAGRYAISLLGPRTSFPVQTLLTNILGAILIGFIVGIASSRSHMSPGALLFWKTGVCGGFTTFSTFSLEAVSLFGQQHYWQGGLYVLLSVACCILGIVCGKKLALLFG